MLLTTNCTLQPGQSDSFNGPVVKSHAVKWTQISPEPEQTGISQQNEVELLEEELEAEEADEAEDWLVVDEEELENDEGDDSELELENSENEE